MEVFPLLEEAQTGERQGQTGEERETDLRMPRSRICVRATPPPLGPLASCGRERASAMASARAGSGGRESWRREREAAGQRRKGWLRTR